MAASRILDIMTDSFLDGITGAALFGKLRRPGAPTELVDGRSPDETHPEYYALLMAAFRAQQIAAVQLMLKSEFKDALVRIGARLKREAKTLDGKIASFSRSKP
jgi:hypothetical protein